MPGLLEQYVGTAAPPPPQGEEPLSGLVDMLNQRYFGGRMPSSDTVRAYRGQQEAALNYLQQHAQNMGDQSRITGAGDSMTFENPDDPTSPRRHGNITPEQWAGVADELRQNFPAIDPEQFRSTYTQMRFQARQAGAIDFYRRAFLSGAQDPQRTVGQGGLLNYLPFTSAPAVIRARVNGAADRLADGKATDHDYAIIGADLANQEQEKIGGFSDKVLNLLKRAPGFAVELATTGGISQLFGRGAASATSRVLGGAATTAVGRGLTRGIGLGADIAAQTALNPAAVAEQTLNEMGRPVALSPEGVRVGEGRGIGESLARGFANQAIEVGTERAGDLIPGRGIFGPRATAFLRRAGINSLGGEMFEERLGEVLRGVTGLAKDYGTTGDIFAGRWREAGQQLGAEAVGFGIFGHAAGLTERAINNARQLPSGGPSIHTLPPLGGAPTPAEVQRYQEVQARVEEGNARSVARWATTAPISELKAWEPFYPGLKDVIESRRQGRAPATNQVVEQVQTDMAAVNQAVVNIVHQPAQGPQPGLEAMPAENAVPNAQVPGPTGPGTPQSSTTEPNPVETGQNLTTSTVTGGDSSANLTPTATGGRSEVSPVEPSTTAPAVTSGQEVTKAAPEALAVAKTGVPGPSPGQQGRLLDLTKRLRASGMSKSMLENIKSNVLAAGSEEATALKYRSSSLAGQYARAYANAVFGERARQPAIAHQEAQGPSPGLDILPADINDLVKERKLTPKQAETITKRIREGKTLDEIGQERGVTREAVRQLEVKAMARLGVQGSADKYLGQGFGERAFDVPQIEGAFFTPEQQRLDPELRAAIKRAKSPLTSEEARAKLLSDITKKILKGQIDAANKQLQAAGEVPLTAEDYRAISELSNGQIDFTGPGQTQAERRAAELFSIAAEHAAAARDSVTTYDSPTHQQLIYRLHWSLAKSNLPGAIQVEFADHVSAVVANMPLKVATAVLQNVKSVTWYGTTVELTSALATVSTQAAAVLEQGKLIGGAFYPSTGQLVLDGNNKGESAREIYAHEFMHAAEGPSLKFSQSREWGAIFKAELANNQLTKYASTNATEGFAEFGRAMYGEGQGARALREKFPRATAFMEKHGLMPESRVTFEKPAELFDKPINQGPLHGDVLLSVSAELQAARRQINPTGVADPTATTNAQAARELAANARFEFQQRADDNLKIAADIAAEVQKKRARLGLAKSKYDLREIIARGGQLIRPWAETLAAKGAFTLEQQQDGSRLMKIIGKPLSWVTDGLKISEADLKPVGAGVIDRLKRQFGFPVEQGASRFSTLVMALHAVHQVERGQAMLDKYPTFITPEQEAVAARLINTVSTEQLKAFDAYITHERNTDPGFFAAANEGLRRLTQLNDWTLETLKSVGWYSQADVDRIKRDHPDYISMARIIEGDELRRSAGNEIKPGWEKKRHGSEKQIVDPILSLESRYAQVAVIIAKQLKDEALLDAANALEGDYLKRADVAPETRLTDIAEKLTALGISKEHQKELIDVIGPELIEHFGMPKWDANGRNFYIMRQNGQRLAMEITSKPLYDLITSNQEATKVVGGITQFISAIPGLAQLPKLVKWVATKGNLVFPVRNMIRDPWHAFQNSDQPFLTTLGRLALGLSDSLYASAEMLSGRQISNVVSRLYFENTGQQLREFAYTKGGAGAEEFNRLKGDSKAWQRTVKVAHKVQEVMELIGFAEHGPRLAAFREALIEAGYTPAEIERALAADPAQSPVPIDVLVTAMQKAANRTVDFSRQGIDTREFNKIVPFFSPQIAGMSQEMRNWGKAAQEMKQGRFGTASKAMLGTMAMYLALELMHWWKFKDDEWYKNLPAHLRYNWWVLGQTKDGGTWGVPKPQGIMLMIGAYLQELLRKAADKDPRFGMATGFVAEQATPRLLPIGVGEAFQVARNEDWRGANIVPKRDVDELNRWEQFRRYQLPYVLDQLSGGLASARLFRGPHEAFRSSRNEPALPVNEYFERLQEVSGAHAQAARLRQRLPIDQEREYSRLHYFERAIRQLSREARGELGVTPTPERLLEIRRLQNRLARQALGLNDDRR